MPVRVQSLRSSVKLQRPTIGSREPGELYVSFPDKQFGVIDAAKVPLDLLAIRFFSTTTDYVGGDFVINGGVGYKAKGPVSAGTFNPAQWDTLATSPALDLKEDAIAAGTTSQYWRGDKSWQTLDKAAVGLDQVNNTSDANKPVSTAQAASDNARVLKAGDTMSGHLGLPTGPAATEAVRKDYVDAAIPTWSTLSGKPATFPPTLPIASSGITGLDTKQASQDAAIAAITSFPEAPTDGKTYGRKDAAWSAVVGGARISDTPPVGPQNGEQWWKSSTGDMFIWYDDGDSQQWVQVNAATPVTVDDAGKIDWFARQTPPVGWLKANGALVSRTTYARLFAAIQTAFGAGDGSTTFGLPDLRGEFVRSWADDRAVDTGRVFGSAQADAYLNHAHTGVAATGYFDMRSDNGGADLIYATSGIVNGPGAGSSVARAAVTLAAAAGATRITVAPTITINASTTGSTETRPRNVALLACIRY